MRSKVLLWFQLTNYFLSANSRRWFCRQQLIWLNDGWSLGNSNNYRQIIHIISRSSNNSRSFSVTLSAPHLIAHFGILDQTNQHHFREKEEQLDFIFNLLEILLISSFYLACVIHHQRWSWFIFPPAYWLLFAQFIVSSSHKPLRGWSSYFSLYHISTFSISPPEYNMMLATHQKQEQSED